MKRRMKFEVQCVVSIWILLCFFSINCVTAAETVSLAEFIKMKHSQEDIDPRYVKFLESSLREKQVVCTYTVTTTSPDQTGAQVERYAPETGWELLRIDDEVPTERDFANYEQDADERTSRQILPTAKLFLGVALSGRVRVDNEDEKTIEFAFTPNVGEDIEVPDERALELIEKMNWRIVVAKDDMRPMRMDWSLNESMSPMPTVKILKFDQEIQFNKDQRTGATLITSLRRTARIKALLLLRVTQEEQLEFSDFDCNVVSANAPD